MIASGWKGWLADAKSHQKWSMLLSPHFSSIHHIPHWPSNLNIHGTDSFPKQISSSRVGPHFSFVGVHVVFFRDFWLPINPKKYLPNLAMCCVFSLCGEALRNASVAGQVDIVKSLLLVKPKDVLCCAMGYGWDLDLVWVIQGGFNPFKWPYLLVSGVITLLTTGRSPSCWIWWNLKPVWKGYKVWWMVFCYFMWYG